MGRAVDMTWWTGHGAVVIARPIIDLMAEVAMAIREEATDAIQWDDPDLVLATGVPVFDELEPKTRVFALAYVLRHLSEPALGPPDLMAWNEGAIGAIFGRARIELECELDYERQPDFEEEVKFAYRRRVRDALAALTREAARYSIRTRKIDVWQDRLDFIADHILWDLDFLQDEIADLDPKRASVTGRFKTSHSWALQNQPRLRVVSDTSSDSNAVGWRFKASGV